MGLAGDVGSLNTQIYNARPEAGAWRHVPASRWDYRSDFGGGGTRPLEIRVGPVQVGPDGVLTQAWQHARYGTGRWLLDSATLSATGLAAEPILPAGPHPESRSRLGLVTNHAEDLGQSPYPERRFVLQWESLPANRDLQRSEPAFATLRVCSMPGPPAHLTGNSDVQFQDCAS